jgi:hypothetical protein
LREGLKEGTIGDTHQGKTEECIVEIGEANNERLKHNLRI